MEFIHKHAYLYKDTIVSFNNQNLWDRLPETWRESLLKLSMQQLLNYEFDSCIELTAFKEECVRLTMPRDPKYIDQLNAMDLNSFSEDRVLKIGMKVKKQHEVQNLLTLIQHLSQSSSVHQFVDIGSGKGYISQVIQHHLGYDVVGIEGSEDQHKKAKTRAEKTKKRIDRKKNPPVDYKSSQYYPVHFFIDFDVDTRKLDEVTEYTRTCDDQTIALLSLHACGDLSPMILDLFSNWDRAHLLVNVGCCYQKIQFHDGVAKGFPLSNTVKGLISKFNLAPMVLLMEMATYVNSEWGQLDMEGLDLRLRKLSFRSQLDEILHRVLTPIIQEKFGCDAVNYHVQKMKSDTKFSTFEFYLKNALDRIKATIEFPLRENRYQLIYTYELENWVELKDLLFIEATKRDSWTNQLKLAGFVALQLILAPVAESLVMLDRFCFLKERNLNAYLIPIFEILKSPRNIAIVATK